MSHLVEDDLKYISGEKFNDGFFFDIHQAQVVDRLDVIDKLIPGKTVLHVGCVDHPLTSDRLRSDHWLHGRLTKLASQCLGIDINREGLDFLRNEFQVDNVCYVDLLDPNLATEITSVEWDYVVFGEILEHVDNPVQFLQAFRESYGRYCKQVIVTVPNAFRFGNISSALKGSEFINSDHRYWFSPFTICKVMYQSGLPVQEVHLCKFSDYGGWKGSIRKWILNRYPLFAEDVLVIASCS